MAPERRRPSEAAIERRAQRRAEKRRIVMRATVDIINEGDLDPSMPKIVERSGIPERSIFRYFDDIADLTTQTITMAFADLAAKQPPEPDTTGTLDERVDDLVERCVAVYEELRYIGQVARRRLSVAPAIAGTLDRVFMAMRDNLCARFEPELAAMDTRDETSAINAAMVLLSFEGYDNLRRRLAVPLDEIAETWRSTLTVLFSPDRRDRGPRTDERHRTRPPDE